MLMVSSGAAYSSYHGLDVVGCPRDQLVESERAAALSSLCTVVTLS
jgi:hypothetical protein